MPKLIILQGLPASGKTSKAKELSKPGINVRISRDILREMLNFGFSLKEEDTVRRIEKRMIVDLLRDGLNVIVDDTNLKAKTIRWLTNIANECNAEIELIKMDTLLDECIRRDKLREKQVVERIIRHMATDIYKK